jgi:hypothetical protein
MIKGPFDLRAEVLGTHDYVAFENLRQQKEPQATERTSGNRKNLK